MHGKGVAGGALVGGRDFCSEVVIGVGSDGDNGGDKEEKYVGIWD